MWWYRHPGIKRLDFSPGDEIPARRKTGQPKTLAEALSLLAEERARAAELEEAAKRAQAQEGVLRNALTALRDELTEEQTKLTKLTTLRDELAEERRKRAETELFWRESEKRANEMEASYNSLADELETATEYTSELEEEIESERRKAEDIRYDLEQDLTRLHRESDELRQTKERVASEHESLSRRYEEIRIRLDESVRALTLRDGELQKHQLDFAASERAHREVHVTADSMVRSLAEERNRRITAERQVEQLQQELRRVIMMPPSLLSEAQRLTLLELHSNMLSTELQEVKHHRDVAVEEQLRLAARLLQLMSPGRYLEHAAASGYDITADPLIKRMQHSVLVEGQLAQWQRATGKRQRARVFDAEQTVVEQAYAAAIKERWKHIDHPHKSFKRTPYWIATGILLDAESERHLLRVADDRIAMMQTKMTR